MKKKRGGADVQRQPASSLFAHSFPHKNKRDSKAPKVAEFLSADFCLCEQGEDELATSAPLPTETPLSAENLGAAGASDGRGSATY